MAYIDNGKGREVSVTPGQTYLERDILSSYTMKMKSLLRKSSSRLSDTRPFSSLQILGVTNVQIRRALGCDYIVF